MKLPFFQSLVCKGRKSCRICRSTVGGERSRASWATTYKMPASWPTCEPLGLPMTDDPLTDLCAKPEATPPARGPRAIDRSRALWLELHGWAIAFDGTIAARDAWLAAWLARVPSYGCDCRRDAARWMVEHPAPGVAADLFAWSVAFHNFVNAKLGKPTLSEEQAREAYAREANNTA